MSLQSVLESPPIPTYQIGNRTDIDYKSRLSFIEQRIREIGKQMFILTKIDLVVDREWEASAQLTTVNIPFWFLLKREDLPKELIINDGTNITGKMLDSAIDWINTEMEKAGYSKDFFI